MTSNIFVNFSGHAVCFLIFCMFLKWVNRSMLKKSNYHRPYPPPKCTVDPIIKKAYQSYVCYLAAYINAQNMIFTLVFFCQALHVL